MMPNWTSLSDPAHYAGQAAAFADAAVAAWRALRAV